MSNVSIKEAARAIEPDEELIARENRNKEIVKTSIIGVIANIFLAAFKAFIGSASGSIAIVMDAVNNLSDAGSSIITIVGTKLAGKPADKKHPYGYGRIEYLSAMVISIIVLYAGITSFTESVKKIISPETPEYSTIALIIVAVAVAVKLVLGMYVKNAGVKLNSDSLVNSGEDARMDAVISASTLVAAVIFIMFHVSLEAWLGAVISVVIIKSGVEMLRDTLSQILGERADVSLARKIKKIATSYPEVRGAYDLILNNYGPDIFNASMHIEVPDTMQADEIDVLTRKLSIDVLKQTGVILTAISVYSYNTKDAEVAEMRENIKNVVMGHKNVLQIHAFYVDKVNKSIRFDFVVSFDENDRVTLYKHVREDVEKLYPDYRIDVAMDTDFSDT